MDSTLLHRHVLVVEILPLRRGTGAGTSISPSELPIHLKLAVTLAFHFPRITVSTIET